MWWHSTDRPLPDGLFDLAYTIGSSSFRGEQRLQLTWVEARHQAVSVVEALPRPQVLAHDYRGSSAPVDRLRALLREPGVAGQINVWAEGASTIEGIPFRDREQLSPAACLAVWTIPPGPSVLYEALSRVSPQQVAFFDVDPGLDELGPFLQRLLGLTKHVLRAKGGEMSLEALAGQMAHAMSTVWLGLQWLADRGQVEVVPQGEDRVLLRLGTRYAARGRDVVQEQLQEALEEASAYRSYYRRADLQVLLDVSQGW